MAFNYKSPVNLVYYIKKLGSRLQINLKNTHIWTVLHKKLRNIALQHGFLNMLGKNANFLFSFGV